MEKSVQERMMPLANASDERTLACGCGMRFKLRKARTGVMEVARKRIGRLDDDSATN